VRYVDALLNIALADDLETEFAVEGLLHADDEMVAMLLAHPGIHIGSADAGAHITQFAGAGDTTYLLEHFVRRKGFFTLEQAVHRLTGNIARDWQMRGRGELVAGNCADLVLFDPDTVARGDEIFVEDVPGGAGRFVRHASGISHVIVNGQVVVEHGHYTDARPGQVV